MDAKLIKLIEIIRNERQIAPAELAERLGVSVRTVRTYVNRINALLAESDNAAGDRRSAGRIEMKSSSTYRFEGVDPSLLDELLGTGEEHQSADGTRLPETTEGRVAYLMNDLLYRADWITIDDLAQILFVSRATVSEDLKEVEQRLGRFDLSIERRPRYGIRVVGPEIKRRLCLAALAASGSVPAAACATRSVQDVINAIDAYVGEVTERGDFQINALARQNLLVHIAVSVMRIRESCYVPMEDEQLGRIRATREFPVAQEIARRVERHFGVELPESEVAYIAIHLAGRQSLYFPADAPENELVISDEVWGVVELMVERVWDAFRFDFRDDLELRMNLACHVTPLAVRLRYHMRMENPLLSDIKHRYPLAWTMAVEASAVLSRTYEARLSDDEVGYIALAFELALERQKGEANRRSILIVCASGAGAARLLEQRYRREFGAYLDRVQTCDVGSVDRMDFSRVDYVFTTVPLKRRLPVPVCEVSLFLDGGDIHRVREALEVSAYPQGVGAYFDRGLFFPHFEAANKREALGRLCELVAERHPLPEGFSQLVWDREEASPTSFGNRVSMPHPLEPCTPDTFVAVALLDEPVRWAPDVDVRAIFLVSVSTSTKKNLQGFYDRMSRLLMSPEDIETLISRQDFDTLLELLNR